MIKKPYFGKSENDKEAMNIIAICGNSLKKKETLEIDRYIVKTTSKKTPRVLFRPTASYDPVGHCAAFDHFYGVLPWCKTDKIHLYRNPYDRVAATRKIKSVDLIYVEGSNALRMMIMWLRLGIDELLIKVG